MLLRLSLIFMLALAVSGCATTQSKTESDQLESRVTDLEKKLESKDAEIVDLQYQVKDLSSKIDSTKSAEPEQGATESMGTDVKMPKITDSSDIIRVDVRPEKVQRALQAAGVYSGKIDGKIGAGTKEAIVEFQKSHGLKSDGVLGKKTWEELKEYLKS